jgi:hypothetical protein
MACTLRVHRESNFTNTTIINTVNEKNLLKKLLLFLLFISMGWDQVFELRLSTGTLFIPQVIFERGEPWWDEADEEGTEKFRMKTCPSATVSTTNPTCPDTGVNLYLRSERQATNCLSHGTNVTILGTTCLKIVPGDISYKMRGQPWNV